MERDLQHPTVLPFGSGGGDVQLAAQGTWILATDPSGQRLLRYNVRTGRLLDAAVLNGTDLLPVQGWGLAWTGQRLALALAGAGEVTLLSCFHGAFWYSKLDQTAHGDCHDRPDPSS